jgi:Tfp pilus assembly PilM family ATPase
MNALGIYIGPKFVSLAVSDGKKFLNNIQIPLYKVLGAEPEGKVPDEIKIAAAIKEELKKNNIEAKDANLVLPGKDLIIRTFHMMAVPASELYTAVRFEAKKYIPFKVEELISDFQVVFDKLTRKNFVLFVGIKKEVLDKYAAVFKQLNINCASIDYAGFSFLRLLQLSKIKDKSVNAVLAVDLAEEDEINFVVLEDGFPLFSRDIALSAESSLGLAKAVKPDLSEIQEKLKVELRISFDFYLRKFPTKNIKNVLVVSSEAQRPELEAFIKERGLALQFIDTARIIDKPVPFSLCLLKSFSGTLSKTVKSALNIDLLVSKEKKKSYQTAGGPGMLEVPVLGRVRLDKRVIIAALFILCLPFAVDFLKRKPVEEQLTQIISGRPAVSSVSADKNYEELSRITASYRQKITAINSLFKERLLITPELDSVARTIPDGVWLRELSFNANDKGMVLNLVGSAYLQDSAKERQAVNKFLASLKENPNFNKNFKNISVVSVDQARFEKSSYTTFLIVCRSK